MGTPTIVGIWYGKTEQSIYSYQYQFLINLTSSALDFAYSPALMGV